MKSLPLVKAPVARDAAGASRPLKVCMHVLRDATTDVRVIRGGTTLLAQGFDVSVIDVQQDRARPAREDVQGMHMQHLLIPNWQTSRRSELAFFIIALRTFILSIVQLTRSGADIYHATELTALPACALVAALRRKPLVYEAYELPIPFPETSIAFWHKSANLLKRFLAFVLPRCAGVIATTPFYAREMQKHFDLKEVCLLRNIPPYQTAQKSDRLRQYLGLGPETRIALYHGRVQADRGLDKVIRAAAYLEEHTVIVLMSDEDKATKKELEQLIERCGVADRVKFVPPTLKHEDLLDWTVSADIGLVLYTPEYSLAVKLILPNKLFEYIMAGVPVLATQLDAVAQVITTYDVGRIAPSTKPEDLGAAINAMLADREALARMSRNALEAAKRDLHWEKESKNLVSLYQKIRMRYTGQAQADKSAGGHDQSAPTGDARELRSA